MQRKSKKSNVKLVKKKIINKLGKEQTVYIDPITGIDIPKGTKKILKRGEDKSLLITKRGVEDTQEFIRDLYSKKYPVSYSLMTNGKWKLGKDDKYILVANQEKWKQLLEEHKRQIIGSAKKYSFGKTFGDRFEELKAVANLGFVEGVNHYGKFKDSKDLTDFNRVVYSFVIGRLKETISNRLQKGLRISKNLNAPFSDYKKVRDKLIEKHGVRPKRELVIKELQKKWTKKTFLDSYKTADQRDYGNLYEIKNANGKVIKTSTDAEVLKEYLKKNRKKFNSLNISKRIATFNDLSIAEKIAEREKDKLPLTGYVSINKEGVIDNKNQKHVDKLNKIEKQFDNELRKLKQDYLLIAKKHPNEQKRNQEILDNLQARVGETERKIRLLGYKKTDEVTRIQDSKIPEDEKKLSLALSFSKIDKEIEDLKLELEKNRRDLQIAKDFYKTMTPAEFREKRLRVEFDKKNMIDSEIKRFNTDTKSTYISGITERVKEFEQLESIKELPLQLNLEDSEGGSNTVESVTIIPNNLSQDEQVSATEQLMIGKQILKDNLDLLAPVYADTMKLIMGLHQESENTKDNIWGELKTNNEVIKFLERKYRKYTNPKNLYKVLKSLPNIEDRQKLIGVLPFITERYFKNIDLVIKDYDKWNTEKITEKKVKIPFKQYKKMVKSFIEKRKKAKVIWNKWKKGKRVNQTESTKKYNEIKKKLGVYGIKRPKNTVMKKLNAKEKVAMLKQWQTREPKLFSTSLSDKQKYVQNVFADSREILRRTVPLKVVRDLLTAHNTLISHGVILEKSLKNKMDEEITND